MSDATGRVVKKLLQPLPLVELHWGDAWGVAGWREPKGLYHSSLECISVGYLVQSNKAGVTLAHTETENGDLGGVSFRPRGMIRRLRVLRAGRKQ